MLTELRSIKSIDDLRLLYFKYKDSVGFTTGLVFVLVTLTAVVSIWIVMPQLDKWFSIQKEVTDTRNRISLLKSNRDIVASMDQALIDKQFSLMGDALPFEKNFTGVVTAIDGATLVSGMRRDDYSFTVGNLSTKSAQLSPSTVISVKIKLVGDPDKLLVFLQTMQKLLPLSEIVALSHNAGSTNVEINFFYKYKLEDLQIPYTDPLRTLTDGNNKLLQTLEKNNNEATELTPALVEDEVSSSSAL